MKNSILICLFLSLYFGSLKAQEQVNVALSFRPTTGASSSQRTINSPSVSSNSQNYKSKYTYLDFNFSVEMFSKKGFYHFPLVGFEMLDYSRQNEFLNSSDLIIIDEKNTLNNSTFSLGYGIGKYIFVYKENVFLNFKNSLALHYGLTNSMVLSNTYSGSGVKTSTSETVYNEPNTYGLVYELNPSLGYKLKRFSLSVGFPMSLGLDIENGNQKVENTYYDLVSNSETTTNRTVKISNTSFNFRYTLELGLRYHFPSGGKQKNKT